jgi:YD repeat-containing protein
MGFFSKCCAKSHLPVVTFYRDGTPPELNQVVALTPDGRVVEGSYDGYGRVAGEDFCDGDYEGWLKVKFVLKMHYNGESYKDLPKSGDELAQGYFMADEFIDHCMKVRSFKSRKEYEKSFKELAGWI